MHQIEGDNLLRDHTVASLKHKDAALAAEDAKAAWRKTSIAFTCWLESNNYREAGTAFVAAGRAYFVTDMGSISSVALGRPES